MPETIDDLFSDSNIPKSNFFKFNKVGDRVGGELVEITDKPAQAQFGAQRVFTLKTTDGEFVKVGIPMAKEYVITRANSAKLGDYIGFLFKAEIPASKPGLSPAKSIEVYVKNVAPQETSA